MSERVRGEGEDPNDQKMLPVPGLSPAPFISIPDCEAKSCAHQSQGLQSDSKWWQEEAAEIQTRSSHGMNGPLGQDFSGNDRLFLKPSLIPQCMYCFVRDL